MGRYLPANRVPAGLFSGDCLRLPDSLCRAYCAELHPRELPAGLASQFSSEISTEAVQSEAELLGLPRHARPSLLHLALAAIPHEEKITGGEGDKTLRHFARRFAVSCARVQLCLLGTRPGLADVADDLLAFFSEGKVAVLEAPCGAGAASLALVETLRALRHGGVLPRQPLELRCLGADLETAALDLYSSMLSRVEGEAEGVRLYADATQWDACRADSTARMLDRWFAATADCHRHLFMVSNFSGALDKENVFQAFAPGLEQITGRLANRDHRFLWVEPSTKSAPKVFDRFQKLARARLPFVRGLQEDEVYLDVHCQMRHALRSHEHGLSLTVRRYDRFPS